MQIRLEGPRTPENILTAFAAGQCRATAFGLPLERLSSGPALTLLEHTDRGWKRIKRMKHRLAARRRLR